MTPFRVAFYDALSLMLAFTVFWKLPISFPHQIPRFQLGFQSIHLLVCSPVLRRPLLFLIRGGWILDEGDPG
ncbi:hypothetical protein HMPREF0294_2031 [Corynebacterium glucuronolyticum ATCC 51867]|nr:hypothetical protein HMPREF0294_2031 [Corynebacterium glucuronolyticum ATCC 51867]